MSDLHMIDGMTLEASTDLDLIVLVITTESGETFRVGHQTELIKAALENVLYAIGQLPPSTSEGISTDR